MVPELSAQRVSFVLFVRGMTVTSIGPSSLHCYSNHLRIDSPNRSIFIIGDPQMWRALQIRCIVWCEGWIILNGVPSNYEQNSGRCVIPRWPVLCVVSTTQVFPPCGLCGALFLSWKAHPKGTPNVGDTFPKRVCSWFHSNFFFLPELLCLLFTYSFSQWNIPPNSVGRVNQLKCVILLHTILTSIVWSKIVLVTFRKLYCFHATVAVSFMNLEVIQTYNHPLNITGDGSV